MTAQVHNQENPNLETNDNFFNKYTVRKKKGRNLEKLKLSKTKDPKVISISKNNFL